MLRKRITITTAILPSFHVSGVTIWKPLQTDESFLFVFFGGRGYHIDCFLRSVLAFF